MSATSDFPDSYMFKPFMGTVRGEGLRPGYRSGPCLKGLFSFLSVDRGSYSYRVLDLVVEYRGDPGQSENTPGPSDLYSV